MSYTENIQYNVPKYFVTHRAHIRIIFYHYYNYFHIFQIDHIFHHTAVSVSGWPLLQQSFLKKIYMDC